MSSLLDLPFEIICLILEEVGGRELRRGQGSGKLAVSRTWYAAALPIYLSGFGSSIIQLHGHDIEKIRSKFGHPGLRHLMHKNTRDIRIHLLGHPWDEATAHADEDCEYSTWNEPPFELRESPRLIQKSLQDWRDVQLKPCLNDLFDDLRNFKALENVVIEARSELADELFHIPAYDYIHVESISRLLLNLPITHCLASLTLDTCGTELLGPGHVCKLIAGVLPRIENVRLRMARLCPDVLNFKTTKAVGVKLKSLIIKLHMPRSRSRAACIPTVCKEVGDIETRDGLVDHLATASQTFLAGLDAVDSGNGQKVKTDLRISYIPATFPCVHVLECRSLTQYRLRDERHAYEDDGKPCWLEMEGDEMLVDCGTYCQERRPVCQS